jgi:hypothetical protein
MNKKLKKRLKRLENRVARLEAQTKPRGFENYRIETFGGGGAASGNTASYMGGGGGASPGSGGGTVKWLGSGPDAIPYREHTSSGSTVSRNACTCPYDPTGSPEHDRGCPSLCH